MVIVYQFLPGTCTKMTMNCLLLPWFKWYLWKCLYTCICRLFKEKIQHADNENNLAPDG